MKTKLTTKERWRKGYSQYRYLTNILGKGKWETRHLAQYAGIDAANCGWDTLLSNLSLIELTQTARKAANGSIPDNLKALIRRRMKSNYIPLPPVHYENDD